MIGAEEIQRAENALQLIYKDQDMGRQLAQMEVEREAFTNWLEARQEVVRKHYPDAWAEMDPRILPAFNTLFMHAFIVGIYCAVQETLKS